MRGKLACLVLIAASMLLAGCKKDAEINAALAEVDAFTMEIMKRVDRPDNPMAGIDNAQQYLDLRKREIAMQARLLTRVRGIQASSETRRKMIETVRRDQQLVSSLQARFSGEQMNDATFKTKLDKLVSDYMELFQS